MKATANQMSLGIFDHKLCRKITAYSVHPGLLCVCTVVELSGLAYVWNSVVIDTN